MKRRCTHSLYRPCARTARNILARGRAAFSLIELVVVVAIIAILGAVLLGAVKGARESARTIQCTSNMRNVAMGFQLFATNSNSEGQGDSADMGPSRFRVNDVQDLLYGVDEFWSDADRQVMTLTPQQSLMLCPSAAGKLTKRAGFPCGSESLGPLENVSIALNMRLYRGITMFNGRIVLVPTQLSYLRDNTLDHPYTPLAFDVNGPAAVAANHDPFYISPGLEGSSDPYSSNRFWFPSDRHRGSTLVAFIGGHVKRSATPADEPWSWSYSAYVGP